MGGGLPSAGAGAASAVEVAGTSPGVGVAWLRFALRTINGGHASACETSLG
ncbi:hypothetical protein [Actinokineospora globicatena]|uniref:hypothetical protein n=1 Tax=Actinokineospora globicatena TaxID=103729 RepID=UPI0025527056|nr:hypothetical protein [Actinokineospora globicatena]